MNLIGHQGSYPVDNRSSTEYYLPLSKLKGVLMKMLSNKQVNTSIINKFEEYLQFNDVSFFTWKVLSPITAKSNPNEHYIMNFITLLQKLRVEPIENATLLCSEQGKHLFRLVSALKLLIIFNLYKIIVYLIIFNFYYISNFYFTT